MRLASVALLLLTLPSCATLQGLAALSQVRFGVEGVSELSFAGIPAERLRSFEQLSATDLLRVSTVLVDGRAPLAFTLDLTAANPSGNPEARLVALDWTLLLEGRETVSGSLTQGFRFPAGEVSSFPLELALDLRDFFEGGAGDLLDLVMGIAGVGGHGVDVRLRAIPTLDTPIGPIRYPEPVMLTVRGR